MKIELNSDIAESAPYDDEILGLVQRANVCLGAHAGSPDLTRATLDKCKALGVAVAAHPGYPDWEGKGRRPFAMTGLSQEATQLSLMEQMVQAVGFADAIKPHGGLYNDSVQPGPAWDMVVELLRAYRLPLIGLPGTSHEDAALAAGVDFVPEGFGDRGVTPDGRLIPRGQPGDFLTWDEMVLRVPTLVATVKSICVHGDGDDPVGRLKVLKQALEDHGVELMAWKP